MRKGYQQKLRWRFACRAGVAALAAAGAIGVACVCSGQCISGVCPVPGGWQSAPAVPPNGVGVPVGSAVRSAVCRVANEVRGSTSLGTGALVHAAGAEGYVLTCEHLYRDGVGRVSVRFADTQQRPAELFARDPVNDLALLRVADPPGAPLIAVADPPGEWLTTVGLGSSGALRAIRGRVLGRSAPRGLSHGSVIIQGALRQGDSGGPVLNQNNQVVGVVWGTQAGRAYATLGDPLRRMLAMLPQAGPRSPAVQTPHAEPPQNEPRTCPCGGNCVQPSDLIHLVKQSDLDRVLQQVTVGCEARNNELEARLAALGEPRDKPSRFDWLPRDAVQLLLAGLGVGGPIGAAMLLAKLLVRRKLRNRRGSGGPRDDGFPRAE